MNITDVTTKTGAHKRRKRVGRGQATGLGKTCGRGHKGTGQRAGHKYGRWHEGGALPLFRRVAKRGFSNKAFRTLYQIVNVGQLDQRFEDGGHVTAAALAEVGLVSHPEAPIKVLGDGALARRLTVDVQRFSETAVQKIEAAGGTVHRLGPQPKKRWVRRPAATTTQAKG